MLVDSEFCPDPITPHGGPVEDGRRQSRLEVILCDPLRRSVNASPISRWRVLSSFVIEVIGEAAQEFVWVPGGSVSPRPTT